MPSSGTQGRSTAGEIPSPGTVAAAGWFIPGSGYWLIGERIRGVTVGVTVVVLFALGLLVGGVRVLEVPTYNRQGDSLPVSNNLVREIQTKPWSVAQVMMGPVGIAGGAASVWAARTGSGAESHARINEIGVLYTAVAGMLNLLAIIDAAHRAGRLREGR